jgi:hypothetical protein
MDLFDLSADEFCCREVKLPEIYGFVNFVPGGEISG